MGSAARKTKTVQLERSARIERGRSVIEHGTEALKRLASGLDDEFSIAVDRIVQMRGSLIVSGIGKAGLVGRKLSATFASTGTRSHFLHPSEALHGDLGCIGSTDILLVLSNSGTTQEILDLLPFLARRASGLIAITSGANSPLSRAADVALILPPMREACRHNLAPTTSTLAMLALGDALAMVVSEAKGFQIDDFADLHPGGALGRKLASVDEVMRPLTECRVGRIEATIRETLVESSKPGRRSGAVMILDTEHRLRGIFTDSDLARILEQRCESELDQPVATRMTTHFSAIQAGAKLSDAISIMTHRKISELPVINDLDQPIGMIDITDLLAIQESPAIPDGTAPQETSGPSTSNHASGSRSKVVRPTAANNEANEPSSDLAADRAEDDEWLDGPTTLRIFGPLR